MHALAEPVVQTVQAALQEGLIVGLVHPIWQGPDACAFATLNAYLEEVQKASPGYLFTLWSVPALERRGMLLDNFDQLRALANRVNPPDEFAVLPLSELLAGTYIPRLHLVHAERADRSGSEVI